MSTGKEAKKSGRGKKGSGRAKGTQRRGAGSGLSAARMAEMIEEATVDGTTSASRPPAGFRCLRTIWTCHSRRKCSASLSLSRSSSCATTAELSRSASAARRARRSRSPTCRCRRGRRRARSGLKRTVTGAAGIRVCAPAYRENPACGLWSSASAQALSRPSATSARLRLRALREVEDSTRVEYREMIQQETVTKPRKLDSWPFGCAGAQLPLDHAGFGWSRRGGGGVCRRVGG
jgi:hypothetical protein